MLPSGWNTYVGVAIKILSGVIAILTYFTHGTMTSDSATGIFGLYALGSGIAVGGQAKQSTLIKGIALQEKVPVAVVNEVIAEKK